MKRILRGLAALSALASLGILFTTPAQAQSLSDPNQWIVKLGVTMPSEGLAREIGSTWMTGGLEYQAGDPNARRVSSVEVLYSAASDEISEFAREDVSAKFQMISLMLNHRFRSLDRDGEALGDVLFYGAGLGVQVINADIEDPNPGGFGTIDERYTFAGANLFVGYEFAANFEVQAKYQLIFGKIAGENLHNVQFLAGIKF